MLASGEVFYGFGAGKCGSAIGEICFNTGLTGYQEVLTDPSYCAQIITFTFPHIGNVGTNADDMESSGIAAAGAIFREAITPPSNFRATHALDAFLQERGVTAISGIDTRALTRLIRLKGAQNAMILYPKSAAEWNELDALRQTLAAHPSLKGQELSCRVTTDKAYDWTQTAWEIGAGHGIMDSPALHVVAIDYGEKYNILRLLASHGCRVTVVPATTPAADILALKPDGVFLSNGPGDPAATSQFASPILQTLMQADIPIFGICLGHQLLALALGASTEKMHQGHRGANHPVQDLASGLVEITSQNHGFVVSHGSLPANARITHLSLFDGTIEGFALTDKPVFAVQYHPESSPGPHDSRALFAQFVTMMEQSRAS
jgi:carbamoyl-phosphate synthase small subunit